MTHDQELNLKQVARRLDVHYMTVYRYVRQGRLPARRAGSVWMVDPADVDALAGALTAPVPAPSPRRSRVDWPKRLAARLVGGDEIGAWTVVRDALNAGHDVPSIHLDVVAGAIAQVSHDTGAGTCTAATERVAVATATRILARLGAQFPHRGRKRGTVVLAAPSGEHHGVPLLLVANLLRHAGYRVVELGTDTPPADVVATLEAHPTSIAVGLGVTTVDRLDAAIAVIDAVHRARPDVPVLLGGQAVRNPEVATLAGASAWSAGPDLVEQLEVLRRARSRARTAAEAPA